MPKKKRQLSSSVQKKLKKAAERVMKNAHAPYSNFRVGSAILLTNGKTFTGCNVENASYGMTNCAERTAIFSAVAELGPRIEIAAVAVTNDHGVACSPCGACRQVINEFGPKIPVVSICDGEERIETTLDALLPHAFGPHNLEQGF